MKFLHAADLHLDSALQGLEKYEGAPVDKIRCATRRALEKLVALAVERKVDFVLIAGDIYDGDWRDFNTGLFFGSQMARLKDQNIPVYLISGNHDAANKMTRSLKLPGNVRMLSTKQPETVRLDDFHTALHGLSFASASEAENVARNFPAPVRGWFNIGLLHTSLDYEAGGEHACYAPCKMSDLEAKEYDYWALGHIHQREQRGTSWHAVFPGNIQGRHIRETGAKGCVIVTVGANQSAAIEFHALDVFRWEHCIVDAAEAADADELLERFRVAATGWSSRHEQLPLGLRVTFRGRCAAHADLLRSPESWVNQVRAVSQEIAGGNVWVEKVRVETSDDRRQSPPASDGPLAELAAAAAEMCASDSQLQSLRKALTDLREKLPVELKEGNDALPLDDPEWLKQLLRDTEPLLIGKLGEEQMA